MRKLMVILSVLVLGVLLCTPAEAGIVRFTARAVGKAAKVSGKAGVVVFKAVKHVVW